MAENTSKLVSRNQMSAKALVIKQNSPIEFVPNPQNGGHFFTCGEYVGYISPAVKEKMDTITLDEMQFCEASKDGVHFVPCLMTVGKKNKPTRTLGMELLHAE